SRDSVPVYDINWHLLASANATHPQHIDANGFNTEIYVECGIKLLFIGRSSPTDPNFVGRTTGFSDFRFDMTGLDSADVIGLLLLPGDRFVMRACTPHYVVTLEPALCHGAHFYSVSTMEQSNWALIHTFFRSREITNSDHSCYHDMLVRIVVHWHDVIVNSSEHFFSRCATSSLVFDHLPNVRLLDGLMQALSLFNLIEMGTLLDGKRYEGRSDARLEDLYQHARSLCKEIVGTIDANLDISVGRSRRISVERIASHTSYSSCREVMC
ncbi:hypothetical protein MPER_04945, partial [Moniliophthora perniciosa FA553]